MSTDTPAPSEVDALQELAAENERLRAEYRRARKARYDRAAIAMAAIASVAVVGALAFDTVRTVLLALAGTGYFGAVLTYYLAPESFVAASVGERVYRAYATLGSDLRRELGLQHLSVYLPTAPGTESVTLFVPQHRSYALPTIDELETCLITSDHDDRQGLALSPTGDALLGHFEETHDGSLPASPAETVSTLVSALREEFELIDRAETEVDPGERRISVAVTESPFGSIDRFDHPVGSFLACGLAVGLDRPVSIHVEEVPEKTIITCRWAGTHDSIPPDPDQ